MRTQRPGRRRPQTMIGVVPRASTTFSGWFPFQFTFREFSPSLRCSPKAKNERPSSNAARSSPHCHAVAGAHPHACARTSCLVTFNRCRPPPAGEVTRSRKPSTANRRRKEKEKLRMRSKPNRCARCKAPSRACGFWLRIHVSVRGLLRVQDHQTTRSLACPRSPNEQSLCIATMA